MANMNRVFFSIPKTSWESFKQDILTTWFEGTPLLKRYITSDDKMETAVFYCESEYDANLAISKTPKDGTAVLIDLLEGSL